MVRKEWLHTPGLVSHSRMQFSTILEASSTYNTSYVKSTGKPLQRFLYQFFLFLYHPIGEAHMCTEDQWYNDLHHLFCTSEYFSGAKTKYILTVLSYLKSFSKGNARYPGKNYNNWSSLLQSQIKEKFKRFNQMRKQDWVKHSRNHLLLLIQNPNFKKQLKGSHFWVWVKVLFQQPHLKLDNFRNSPQAYTWGLNAKT